MTKNSKRDDQADQNDQQTVTEKDSDLITDTNAGSDAQQGTIADQKAGATAPARDE